MIWDASVGMRAFFSLRSHSILEFLEFGYPRSHRSHHISHSETITLANLVENLIVVQFGRVFVLPLTSISWNLLQSCVEILVLLQIKLAIAIDISCGPGIVRLLHLLSLVVLVFLVLAKFLHASGFLLRSGGSLPSVELGFGQLVDFAEYFSGKRCCCFCHLLLLFF